MIFLLSNLLQNMDLVLVSSSKKIQQMAPILEENFLKLKSFILLFKTYDFPVLTTIEIIYSHVLSDPIFTNLSHLSKSTTLDYLFQFTTFRIRVVTPFFFLLLWKIPWNQIRIA